MTKLDVSHRFEYELEVPGSPEQVWRAIASADGIAAWMTPTELDARLGGAVTFHMGPEASSHGRVTAFEPARRIAYEEDWATLCGHAGADVTPLLTEFVVEARSGGTCVVRVVTSAFGTGADWEHEFWDDMDRGWAPMLDNLRLYLTYFPDQRATPMFAVVTFPGTTPETAIAAVRRDLAVDAVGDPVSARGVVGRLERMIERHMLLRLEEPVPGLVSLSSYPTEDASAVYLTGYLFTAAAPGYVEREQPTWQAWLEEVAADVASTKPG
jgi:uncharacterized protein YndB with AHSA1/START domain